MRKILGLVLTAFICITVLTIPVGNAQIINETSQNEREEVVSEEVVSRIAIDTSLTIEKTEDGRVLPVKNAKNLTTKQLDIVLRNMEMDDDLISNMPLAVKQHFVSTGGVAVPVTTEKKEYFRTSDGKRILVTEENKDEIDKIKQEEIAKLSKIEGLEFTTFGENLGSDASGDFRGYSALTYLGKTSGEFQYQYADWFHYDADVTYRTTDKIARAWQDHTVSVKRHGFGQWVVNGWYNDLSISTHHNGGTTGSYAAIKLPSSSLFDKAYGYYYDNVNINKSVAKNTTGKWVVKYAHPWTILSPSVTIGAVSLEFSSYLGNEWEWESSFDIPAS